MINILLITYASFTCLALAMPRHHQQVFKRPPQAWSQLSIRAAGWCLCLISLWLYLLQADSWSLGLVAWFGCITGASIVFIFLLSYVPRTAAVLGGLAAIVGLVHTLVL